MAQRPLAALGTAVLATAALLLSSPGPVEAAKKPKKKKTPTASSAPVPPRPADPWRVTLTTADGVVLAGSYRPVPGQEGAPALLLLHGFSRDRREWDAFVPDLAARGFATLALDLRGHGESLRKTSGAKVALSPSLQTSPGGFPRDVEAALAWLKQRSPRLGAMGLSLSGGLALLATSAGWADAAVAVSVNADRLTALAGGPVSPRGSFVLASEDDPGRAASARALDAAASEPRRTLLVPGAAHGLDIFRERPETWQEAAGWLVARLGPTPPPVPTPVPEPTPSAEVPLAVPVTPAPSPRGPGVP